MVMPGQDALVIGSRFDTDVSKAACRLAFYGRLVALLRAEEPSELARLRIFKLKTRAGSIDRLAPDGFSAVCKGMFKKDTDISLFAGMKVRTHSGVYSCGDSAVFTNTSILEELLKNSRDTWANFRPVLHCSILASLTSYTHFPEKVLQFPAAMIIISRWHKV